MMNEWMNKMWYIQWTIRYKKEGTAALYNIMDRAEKQCVKQKKPGKKCISWYGFICVKFYKGHD